MECKNCSLELKEDALFCPRCGTKAEKEEKKALTCVSCGETIGEADRFCPSCGARQGAEAPKSETPKQEIQPAYEQPQPQEKPKAVSKKNSIFSMAFGIASLTCGIMSFHPFLVFAAIAGAIIFGSLSNARREAYVREAGASNGFSRAGKITTTISIPVTIVFGIIGVVLFSVMVASIAGLM